MITRFHLTTCGANEPRKRSNINNSETRAGAANAVLLVPETEKEPCYANSKALHQDTVIPRNAFEILSYLEIFVKVASKTTERIK